MTQNEVVKFGNNGVMCVRHNDQVLMYAPDEKLLAIGENRGPSTIIFLEGTDEVCIQDAQGNNLTDLALVEMIENTKAMFNDPGHYPVTLMNSKTHQVWHVPESCHMTADIGEDGYSFYRPLYRTNERPKLNPDTPYLKQVQKALGYKYA